MYSILLQYKELVKPYVFTGTHWDFLPFTKIDNFFAYFVRFFIFSRNEKEVSPNDRPSKNTSEFCSQRAKENSNGLTCHIGAILPYPVTVCYLGFHTAVNRRLNKSPWGPCVLRPPRAAQPSSRSNFSGNATAAPINPPPRRRASPAWKTICGVYSRRSASLRSGRKPFIHGSTGEEQPPARGRGPIGKKNYRRPCR
jgi:hypothetical protein